VPGIAAGIAGGLVALARRTAVPRFAEFDGQVIRQWMVKGDDESPDEYHVAIDDGTRAAARDGGTAPRAGQEAAVIVDFNQY